MKRLLRETERAAGQNLLPDHDELITSQTKEDALNTVHNTKIENPSL